MKMSKLKNMKKKRIRSLDDHPGRLIVVNGVKWKWTTGAGGGVVAYSEKGEQRKSHAWKIQGDDPNQYRRGILTPFEVASWLMESIR